MYLKIKEEDGSIVELNGVEKFIKFESNKFRVYFEGAESVAGHLTAEAETYTGEFVSAKNE